MGDSRSRKYVTDSQLIKYFLSRMELEDHHVHKKLSPVSVVCDASPVPSFLPCFFRCITTALQSFKNNHAIFSTIKILYSATANYEYLEITQKGFMKEEIKSRLNSGMLVIFKVESSTLLFCVYKYKD
jgi:hypothetical protein